MKEELKEAIALRKKEHLIIDQIRKTDLNIKLEEFKFKEIETKIKNFEL